MASEPAHPGSRGPSDATAPSTPSELRIAFGGLLAFAALLPVQVSLRIPGMGATAAVSPADLPLAVSAISYVLAMLRHTAKLRLGSFGAAVGVYLLCVTVSIGTSESLSRSVVRSTTVLVCAAAALLAANLVDSEARLRRVMLAILLGTALTVILGLAAVALFYSRAAPGLVSALTSDFGSLPVGNYPRVSALFARQPNTLCHYLSISLFVLAGSASVGWVSLRIAVVLGVGVLVVSAFTFSLGLGGILLGLAWWLAWNPALRFSIAMRRASLALGAIGAIAFAILTVMAPAPTRDEGVRLPLFSFRAEPSPRVACWKAAWDQFAATPLIGRGLGVQATCPAYVVASGATARLTDAHSMYLSVMSTQGLLGLVGLAAVTWTLLRRSFPLPRATAPVLQMVGTLVIAFVQSWLYQGLQGSFEYTRHGWLVMGLLWSLLTMTRATSRLDMRAAR